MKKYGELVLFCAPLDAATTPDTIFAWNSRLQRWVGIWTGLPAVDMEVTRYGGVHHLIFGQTDGKVREWKDGEDDQDSDTYKDDATAIPTQFWTRGMLFAEPMNDKDSYHAEVRFGVSDAIVTITLVADNTDLFSWTEDVRQTGVSLPINLPFDLGNPETQPKRKGLRGLTPYNECYLKIESTEGWFDLRNISLSAFLNTLRSQ